jgi:hypothetical protein
MLKIPPKNPRKIWSISFPRSNIDESIFQLVEVVVAEIVINVERVVTWLEIVLTLLKVLFVCWSYHVCQYVNKIFSGPCPYISVLVRGGFLNNSAKMLCHLQNLAGR